MLEAKEKSTKLYIECNWFGKSVAGAVDQL